MVDEERDSTNKDLVNNSQPTSLIQSNLDKLNKINRIEDTSKNMTQVPYDYTQDIHRVISKIEANPHEVFSQIVSPFASGRQEDYKVPIVGGVMKWLDVRKAAEEGHPLSEKDLVTDPDKIKVRDFIHRSYAEYLNTAGSANFRPTKEAIESRDVNKKFLAALSLMDEDSLKTLSKVNRKLTLEDKQAIFQEVVNSSNQQHDLNERIGSLLGQTTSTTSTTSTPTTSTPTTSTTSTTPTTSTPTTSTPTTSTTNLQNSALVSSSTSSATLPKLVGFHPHGGNPIVEVEGSRFVLGGWEHPLAKTLLQMMVARETNESKGDLRNKLLEETIKNMRDDRKANLEASGKAVEAYWNAYMKVQEGIRGSKDVDYKELIPAFLQYATAKNQQLSLLGQPTLFDIPSNSMYDIVGVVTNSSGRVIYDLYTGAPLIKVKRKGDPKATEQVWSFVKKS